MVWWFGGLVVRWSVVGWFGGLVVWWFGGSVVRWLVVGGWWLSGSVVRWLGGLVVWWFLLRYSNEFDLKAATGNKVGSRVTSREGRGDEPEEMVVEPEELVPEEMVPEEMVPEEMVVEPEELVPEEMNQRRWCLTRGDGG